MHPILESLTGTEREWLKNLLFAFNSGDIGKFEALAPHFAQEVKICENLYVSTDVFVFFMHKDCFLTLLFRFYSCLQ